MSNTIRFALIGASFLALPGVAFAWSCEHQRDLHETLDLDGVSRLVIEAAAGELHVTGVSGSGPAVVRGTVCASRAEWAEAAGLVIERGSPARITVDLPDIHSGVSFGDRHVSMDLEIEVPDSIALDISDSSGGIELRGIGPVDIADSSGDIELVGSAGPVTLKDSSGDIHARDIGGDVRVIADSSGSIELEDVRGAVLVERDTSGDLEFTRIQGDVVVERDSSGSIRAEQVTGDFIVLKDGSGDIRSSDIGGEVRVPKEG